MADLKEVCKNIIEVLSLRSVDKPHTQRRMLTPPQLRAARALLGWSREDLATKSGLGAETVKNFELRGSDPKLSTLHKWRRALEAAGVIFIDPDEKDGPGVRLKGSRAKR